MDNLNQYDKETFEIFKEECTAIINDFKVILSDSKKYSNEEYITKLMRDAHSIKGSASITGLDEIQKKAHKIEDLLGEMKKNLAKKEHTILLNEVKMLLFEIENSIKNSDFHKADKKLTQEEIFAEINKNLNLLKTDISYTDKLTELINEVDKSKTSVKNIADISLSALQKIKTAGEIKDKNLINILSGAFKILKKVVIDNNEDYYDELFLLKQRLSVAEQMIDVTNIKKAPIEEVKQEPQKSKFSITNVFENFSESSIRTLRIDSSKLDTLYEKVCLLGQISVILNQKADKIKYIAEKFSENIFEFEKIKSDLINLTDKEHSNLTLENLTAEIQKMSANISDCQKLMKEYEILNSSANDKEEAYKNNLLEIHSIIKNVRNLPIGVILHMFPRMVRDLAEKENKEVEMDITGGEILVDKKILDTIKMPILHLLRNAVDHGIELPEEREKNGKPRAGKISVNVSSNNEKIKISVKDDGCGINFTKIKAKLLKENLSKDITQLNKHDFLKFLFIPGFSTEDKVTEISGRGMGLDIVNSKITEMNGNVHISTTKKNGTEIIIELPVDITPFCYSEKAAPKKKKNDFNVILVDDSQTTKLFFKKLLEDEGYKVTAFENGKDTLKELKSKKYDLLISDVEMPVMNGAELTSKIRKDKQLKNLPILIISMLPEYKIKNLFKDIDVDAVINKSDFNKSVFINTVKYLLDEN